MPKELEQETNLNNPETSQKEQNKKEQITPTTLIVLLSVLVIVAVLTTAKQWVQRLKLPFLIPVEERIYNANEAFTNSDISNLLALQGQDTDGDGLSDYDELYLYSTSPYLEDSDSDGFSDFEELQSGNDPNCPKGAVCRSLGTPAGSGVATEELTWDNIANLSNDQLRALLIEQGLPVDEINKLDDETLRQTYLETLEAIQQPGYYSYLLSETQFNLTPDQIRQMLTSQGMKEEEVAQFTDEELTKIWQEALAQAQAAAGSGQ